MSEFGRILRDNVRRNAVPTCTASLTVNQDLLVCNKSADHEKSERTAGKVTFRSYHYSPNIDMYWYVDENGDVTIHHAF